MTPPMLDFSKLTTPPGDGDVLVAPEPAAWIAAARGNQKSLGGADVKLLDTTLATCRRLVREAVVGTDNALVFVVGHQPAFIHPGVWAKHVLAKRAAEAADGTAMNLVVDSDAPSRTDLRIPAVRNGDVELRSVPFTQLPSGCTYEQIPRLNPEKSAAFERAVRDAMGERYAASMMPSFHDAFSRATEARDWVDQAVTARRVVESHFDIVVKDRRVSEVWSGPLLVDLLARAERFAESYNRALAWYRRTYRVRGLQRPIPDLIRRGNRCEVAMWAYRGDRPRRRLFAARVGDTVRLFAGNDEIGAIPAGRLRTVESVDEVLTGLEGWRLRPRALTLTIWARLLLADLFIHGIGGAKYDRISDRIIADFYGFKPRHMACVSATLLMDLPHTEATGESVRRLNHVLRDWRYNPQRHLAGGPDIDPLMEQRKQAVRRAEELRQGEGSNRQARRAVFDQIREMNAALLEARPEALAAQRAELRRTQEELARNRIALDREYFFGLYDRLELHRLLDALPATGAFRV